MESINLILPHFKAHWRTIAVGLSALIFVDMLQLTVPRVMKQVVDDLTTFRADNNSLMIQAVTIIAMALFIGTFRYIWRLCLLGTARRLEETLRNNLLKHLQTLSATYFDGAKTGDLMAHATNDIQQVRMAAGMGLVAFNDAVVLGIAAIGFMLYIHVELTLYVLIPMPVLVLGARMLSKRMHLHYQKVQSAFSELTEAVRERFSGIRMIKAHHEETAAHKAVQLVSRSYINENIKLSKITGLFFPFMLLLTNLSLALVMFFGGRQTIMLDITPGEFVAFISYLNILAWPMMALGWVTNLIQRGSASLNRLNNIMERQSGIRNRKSAVRPASSPGRIVFENVSFSYGDRDVLQNVDLSVASGEILALVGPPGSGKSSLLTLVPRFYDPQEGRIAIDDHDLCDIFLSDLRQKVGYVPQEPFLFVGTVRENLFFGCPESCELRLDKVLSDAGLDETIARFPAGLDTVVGEKGILLSGGQKQRIALARALLIDAPILLLDDPISQVDAATGNRIATSIKAMAGKKTILIASHRMTAVRFAHRIVTLDNGCVVESGTHEQLLRNAGYYARICAMQELEDAI